MNYSKNIIICLFSVLIFFVYEDSSGKEVDDNFSYLPITNKGEKWRVGYYQGGSSNAYFPYLLSTVNGLADLGWIENTKIPSMNDKDTKELWNWLTKEVKSDYIEFVSNAYYTANWSRKTGDAIKRTIINRLNSKKDLNLVIAMGTWAGKDLANNDHNTPTIVMSSTDPLRAGIIKSNYDSGYDHLFARVDPRRYERQIHIFHDTIGFKKLGVAYEDTTLGRSYAAINIIEKIAKDNDFEIVRCFTKDDIPDQEIAGKSVIQCFEELAPQVDAMYVVIQNGVNPETIPILVSIANRHRVPTFSQQGSEQVKQGFFMGVAREGGFAPVGKFLAISMAKIFNGAKPRWLNQVFEEKPAIAINLKTAETIGQYLSAEILAATDEIYREIENP